MEGITLPVPPLKVTDEDKEKSRLERNKILGLVEEEKKELPKPVEIPSKELEKVDTEKEEVKKK